MSQLPFRHRPVRRYRTPQYAKEGYRIPEATQRSFWSKWLNSKLLAGLVPLSISACLPGMAMSGEPAPHFNTLSESDARTILVEELGKKNILITTDVAFAKDSVAFQADGYDAQLEIGFDYGRNLELSQEEQRTLDQWRAASGPYFLILQDADYQYDTTYSSERERAQDKLREDVQSFITFLEGQGII